MKYEFDAEIKRLEGKIQWSGFYFPESAMDYFGSKGNIPVKITVDGHPFNHKENKPMLTVAEYEQWEKNFLIEIEEGKEVRLIFNAVQKLMHDIAIELPRIIISYS
jgi:hypothetical protein